MGLNLKQIIYVSFDLSILFYRLLFYFVLFIYNRILFGTLRVRRPENSS